MLDKRGEIHNRERARQIRDFSGIIYGNITPTDIDGLIEYHGKGYIILELKLVGTKIQFGQKLALERMTDDFQKSGKAALCIIADHTIYDPAKDIIASNTIVREYRYNFKWTIPTSDTITTKQMMDKFITDIP